MEGLQHESLPCTVQGEEASIQRPDCAEQGTHGAARCADVALIRMTMPLIFPGMGPFLDHALV